MSGHAQTAFFMALFRSYEQLPDLAGALLVAGFSQAEVGAILGGNYQRVLEAPVGQAYCSSLAARRPQQR